MPIYEFEIQNCIRVRSEGVDADEARMLLIENIDRYAEEMVDSSCYVSEGKRIE